MCWIISHIPSRYNPYYFLWVLFLEWQGVACNSNTCSSKKKSPFLTTLNSIPCTQKWRNLKFYQFKGQILFLVCIFVSWFYFIFTFCIFLAESILYECELNNEHLGNKNGLNVLAPVRPVATPTTPTAFKSILKPSKWGKIIVPWFIHYL